MSASSATARERRHCDSGACFGRNVQQIQVANDGVVGHDQLGDGARMAQCFGCGLPTLRDEAPGPLALLTPQQPASLSQHALRCCRRVYRLVYNDAVFGQCDLKRPWRRWPASWLWLPRRGQRMLRSRSRRDQPGSCDRPQSQRL